MFGWRWCGSAGSLGRILDILAGPTTWNCLPTTILPRFTDALNSSGSCSCTSANAKRCKHYHNHELLHRFTWYIFWRWWIMLENVLYFTTQSEAGGGRSLRSRPPVLVVCGGLAECSLQIPVKPSREHTQLARAPGELDLDQLCILTACWHMFSSANNVENCGNMMKYDEICLFYKSRILGDLPGGSQEASTIRIYSVLL